ncbi:helix-turn-helix transcriptional regulator [Nocardioides sp. W7]|uniref:helix-turn-helix domain-containing protein n=1 Tax=Nocardioides sp. W7 TaxID=2931390 RepID=UPI001FD498EA|nr:helix-turn-helix transcriptional regulator [Nocardioides sp. W7]
MARRTQDPTSLVTTMGARLRERRLELGLTLSEAARRAEVSTSYLSAVESGSSAASLPVLSRIAHALELTIGEFLAAETTSTVERGRLETGRGTALVSSSALQMQVAFQTSDPGESGDCPLEIAQSSVVAFVLSGKVDVVVDGEAWHLGEGDSLHAQEPESLQWATTGGSATLVWAAAPAEAT